MKKMLRDNVLFAALCALFTGYYLYRMFAITPWYDEIYTYLNFIDKGAVYSATHWPLPNNHVFFSVLSSFFRIFGVYVGLRGVSLLAAVGTLVLLYAFLKQTFSVPVALFGCMAYGAMPLTNTMAVQGRGYSLAAFFLALAVFCGFSVARGKPGKRYYIFFGLSLYLGLYTLMSSVYWVLPVCVCTGLALLFLRRYRELAGVVLSSLAAAGMTLVSYAVLWLWVGAGQISGDSYSGYYMADTLSLIWKFPRTCLLRGFRFMSADSNLQSIDRGAFVRDFKYFGRDTLGAVFGARSMALWYCLLAAVAVAAALTVWAFFRARREGRDGAWAGKLPALLLSGAGFAAVFLVLLVQSVYPFARVMSFLGVFLAVLLCSLLWGAGKLLGRVPGFGRAERYLNWCNLPVFLFCAFRLASPACNAQYDATDYYALDALRHVDWTEHATYLAGDVYAGQQMEFHYVLGRGLDLAEDFEQPEVLVLKKETPTGSWPDVLSEADLERYCLERRAVLYENERYRVYE